MTHYCLTVTRKPNSSPFSIRFGVGILAAIAVAATATTFAMQQPAVTSVQPTVETAPVPNSGDAADDACIWIHPIDPSLSAIIGTDKQGGMGVYNLDGSQIQYITGITPVNVDIRYNFPLGGDRVTLVCFSDESDNSIGVYKVNPATRSLENIEARNITTGISVYGFCMYRSPSSGEYYGFINSDNGDVQQWELFDNGSGRVDAALVRTFSVASQPEGCVADDQLGYFYIGEEEVAIWKYGAEPSAGTSGTIVDDVASGRLTADIEGLTIYYADATNGYLIASSQGSNEYVVYERQGNNRYVMTFTIVTGNGIDDVGNTDGIDVVNFSLGSLFPSGLFIAQDGENDNGNQNFKVVPWQSIANSITPSLTINTSWDPRQVGAGSIAAPNLIAFAPTSGAAGTEVTIAGTNLSGATSVRFNGTSASTFTVDSATQIRAIVPSGATTGKISVITPGGVAVSTNDFIIVQVALPNVPTQLAANTAGSTTIVLAWVDNSDNEDGFKIERRTTGAFAEIARVGSNVTGFADLGLTAGTTYTYRVRTFNNVGNSDYSNEASATTLQGGTEIPGGYELKQAYPNPFRSQTTIEFTIPEPQNVELRIFNSLGQLIRTLSDGVRLAATNYTYQWDGRNDAGLPAPTGRYYVRLDAGPMHETRKLILIK